jgi:hypothetical protein
MVRNIFIAKFLWIRAAIHIFDSPAAMVDTAEKFRQFLREIQNKPLPADSSDMLLSELDTRWGRQVFRKKI